MIYCFDIDGTLCSDTHGNYPEAAPCLEVISKLNKLYDAGHMMYLHPPSLIRYKKDLANFIDSD